MASGGTPELNYLWRFYQGAILQLAGSSFNACISDGYLAASGSSYYITQTGVVALQNAGYVMAGGSTALVPTTTGTGGTVVTAPIIGGQPVGTSNTGTTVTPLGGIVPADGLSAIYPMQVGDAIELQEEWDFFRGIAVSIAQALVTRTYANYSYEAGALATELMKIATRLQPQASYGITLRTEKLSLTDQLIHEIVVVLVQGLKLTPSLTSSMASALVEKFVIASLVAGQAQIASALAERISALASAIPLVASLLRETATFTDDATWTFEAIRQVAEQVMLVEQWTRTMSIIVIEQEDVTLSDSSAQQMLYTLLVNERLWLAHDLAEPAGGVTTWAMNARSGAMSEYRNWAFSSFANLDDRYIAASMDGLYELVGDRDQEEPIIATIGKELVEMSGSHLTGLKAAYVAIRGSGRMYLKIEGSLQTTVYELHASTLATSRINLGKGWRSRYLSWELTTVGQDFDLTGLTFLPIRFTRRVGR